MSDSILFSLFLDGKHLPPFAASSEEEAIRVFNSNASKKCDALYYVGSWDNDKGVILGCDVSFLIGTFENGEL